MKTRKIIALVLTFTLLACGMAGCTSGTSSSTPPQTTTGSVVPTTGSVVPTTSASPAPITVEWVNSYNEAGIAKWAEWVKEKVQSIYPYITVSLETYSSDSVDQINKTKITGEDPPAIFGGFSKDEYVAAGYVYDLKNEPWVKNIQDSVVASSYDSNGMLNNVPLDTNYYGIFYNVDVFKANGLTVPTTLDELYKVCDKLKAAGISPFAAGFGDAWTLQEQFSPIYMSLCAGGIGGFPADKTWYTDKEKLTSNFSDDASFKRSAEIIYSLKDYFSPDPMASDWATALNMVATGKAAMIANGSWTMDGILSINPAVTVSAFPMPVSNNAADSVFVASPGVGPLMFNSKDPAMLDATKKVFEVIYSDESGQFYAETANKISTFKNVDMSFNKTCTDLLKYVADGKSWSNGGIKQFQGAGYGILQSRLQEFLMKDTMDLNGFLSGMNADFKAAS